METYSLSCNGRLFTTPLVMAIVNITPDSFYESCKTMTEKEVLLFAEKALEEGASILDIGGYSTRPQAENISPETELRRVSNAAEWIRKEFPDVPLSVDTFRSNIAEYVVRQYGVAIINDISGGTLDDKMFDTVAKLQVGYILTHMRGTPQTMMQYTHYDNLLAEILDFFQQNIFRLKQLGLKDIILDPGFGFAKTLDQNYELLQKLSYFRTFNLPLLVGISHKSMIYKLLEIEAQEAQNGTTVLNTIALMHGASILRVHNVKNAMETIKILDKI